MLDRTTFGDRLMKLEGKAPDALLTTSRHLATAYAEAIREIESPLSISRYAKSLSISSGGSAYKTALSMIIGFAILLCACVVAFRPPLIQILDISLFLLLFVIAASFLTSKFSRRVIWPVAIRTLTIDYIVKVMGAPSHQKAPEHTSPSIHSQISHIFKRLGRTEISFEHSRVLP